MLCRREGICILSVSMHWLRAFVNFVLQVFHWSELKITSFQKPNVYVHLLSSHYKKWTTKIWLYEIYKFIKKPLIMNFVSRRVLVSFLYGLVTIGDFYFTYIIFCISKFHLQKNLYGRKMSLKLTNKIAIFSSSPHHNVYQTWLGFYGNTLCMDLFNSTL